MDKDYEPAPASPGKELDGDTGALESPAPSSDDPFKQAAQLPLPPTELARPSGSNLQASSGEGYARGSPRSMAVARRLAKITSGREYTSALHAGHDPEESSTAPARTFALRTHEDTPSQTLQQVPGLIDTAEGTGYAGLAMHEGLSKLGHAPSAPDPLQSAGAQALGIIRQLRVSSSASAAHATAVLSQGRQPVHSMLSGSGYIRPPSTGGLPISPQGSAQGLGFQGAPSASRLQASSSNLPFYQALQHQQSPESITPARPIGRASMSVPGVVHMPRVRMSEGGQWNASIASRQYQPSLQGGLVSELPESKGSPFLGNERVPLSM